MRLASSEVGAINTVEATSKVGRSAMRKALWRIVPLIALAYLCAYTDRVAHALRVGPAIAAKLCGE